MTGSMEGEFRETPAKIPLQAVLVLFARFIQSVHEDEASTCLTKV
jgi:hypothetical protein